MERGSNKVFVGALSYNITASEIREKFEPFGRVVDVQVKDGYAFVQYDNQDSVQRAVDELDKTNIFGGGINNVEVSNSRVSRGAARRGNDRGSGSRSDGRRGASNRNDRSRSNRDRRRSDTESPRRRRSRSSRSSSRSPSRDRAARLRSSRQNKLQGGGNPKNPRVFLGGLSLQVDEHQIRRKFRKYGRIFDVLMKDGYAFI